MLLCVKVTALYWALGSLLQTANQLDSFGGVVSQHLLCSSKAGLSSSLICKDITAATRNAELSEDALGFYFCGSNICTRGTKILTLIRLANSHAGIGGAGISHLRNPELLLERQARMNTFLQSALFVSHLISCLKLQNGTKVCDVWVSLRLAT